MRFPFCNQAGFTPIDIAQHNHEGHKNAKYVFLIEEIGQALKEKARLGTVIISGGKKAVWANDLENYLAQASREKLK